MSLNTVLLGMLISTFYGALYHLIRGGKTRKLLLFLVLAWAGFWLGDMFGWLSGWTFGQIAGMNVGVGTLGAFLLLAIGDLVAMLLARKQGK